MASTVNKENIDPALLAMDRTTPKVLPTKKLKAVWDSRADAIFVQCLAEQQAAGNQADNNWKKCVWVAAAEALKGSEAHSGGGPKTANGCKDHWTTMKENFIMVQTLRELSGWSWDDTLKRVVAPDDVWDKYITAHPKAAKWRSKTFPLYDEMVALVDGRYATGEGAFRVAERYSNDSGSDSEVQDVSAGDIDARIDFENDTHSGSNDASDDSSQPQSNDADEPSVKSGRKRAASSADDSASHSQKRGRVSGPAAVSNVADAMRTVAESLRTGENGPSTPQRRTEAIRVVEQDGDLSVLERVKVMRLFRRDIAVADSYLAITAKETRTMFIREELEDF